MSVPFTIEGYGGLVTRLHNDGYVIADYDSVDANKRQLILRHDIDFCLKSAVALARAESSLGVLATYFVAMRSEFYNPLTRASQEGLRSLRALGHRIGLHFDPRGHDSRSDLESAIAADAAVLAAASGGSIDVVSFHRPPKEHFAGEDRLAGLWNAYARRFIETIGYCSDSRGGWRHGDPLSHPSVREGRALQLLTHPIWWTGEANSPELRLQQFLAARLQEIDDEMATNCEIHVPGLAELTFRRSSNDLS